MAVVWISETRDEPRVLLIQPADIAALSYSSSELQRLTCRYSIPQATHHMHSQIQI